MRTTRTILGAIVAAALALPAIACDGDQTEFQETPPAAEEVEIYDEQDQRLNEQQQQQRGQPLPEDGGAERSGEIQR